MFVLFLNDAVQLCVTGDIFGEYDEVVRRPRFRLHTRVIASTLEQIWLKGTWFKVVEKISACEDPGDDLFIECASAANARYLVTGNMRHFPMIWRETLIVTPRQFLDMESGLFQ